MMSDSRVVVFPADDPSRSARILYEFPAGVELSYRPVSVLSDSHVVLSFYGAASGVRPIVAVIDVLTGEVTEVRQSSAAFFQAGLLWVPGGGVFDVVDGDYRHVFDGMIEAAGSDVVVGRQCDDPTTCEIVVVERTSGRVIDADLPDLSDDVKIGVVGNGADGDGVILTIVDPEVPGIQFFDLEQGDFVADGVLNGSNLPFTSSDMAYGVDRSDSGHLLTVWGRDRIHLMDLKTGLDYEIEVGVAGGDGMIPTRVFFAPKAAP